MTHIRVACEKSEVIFDQSSDLCAQPAYTDGQDAGKDKALLVLDDWPDKVPVTLQEVEVIDRFLGSLLDAFLRSAS